jgi:Tfp pilus assembly protein PilN
MRPVNLIPVEERRGEQAPLRSGALAYVLVGALVALLAGVTALVLVSNQISESESEIARLEVEDAREQARAESLAAYTQFRELSEQRVTTVASLADSRFDWERVMRELALVLPDSAWLVELTGSAGGSAEGSSDGGSGLGAAALGPTLELSGCATGQEAVAGFVTALKDIDGVTRVGVQSSELGQEEAGAGGGGGGDSESGDECRTRSFIAKFEIVVAFDAAPVPATEAEAEAAPAAAPEAAQVASSESEGG